MNWQLFGLTTGEVRVYLAMLELGEATVGPIMKRSGISPSKIYVVLNRLVQKGFASYFIKNKKRWFVPLSPQKLIDVIENKMKEVSELKKELMAELPSLLEKYRKAEEAQTVLLYSGYEGLRSFYTQLLSSMRAGDEYMVITLLSKYRQPESFIRFTKWFHDQRARKRVKLLLLAQRGAEKVLSYLKRYKRTQIRFISATTPTGLLICKGMVAHIVWSERPCVYVIKSQAVSEEYTKFFFSLWEKAKA